MAKEPKNRVYKLKRPGLMYVIFSSLEELEANAPPLITEYLKDAEMGEEISIKVIEMTTKQLEELPDVDE